MQQQIKPFSNENVHTISLKDVLKRQDLINFMQQAIIYDHHYYQFSFTINKIDQNLTIRADLNRPKEYQDGTQLMEWLEQCYGQIRQQIDQLVDPDQSDQSQGQISSDANQYIQQLFDRNFIFDFERNIIDASQIIEKKLRMLENENKQLKQQLHPDQFDQDQPVANDWGIELPPKQSEIDLIILRFRETVRQACTTQQARLDRINLEVQNLYQKTKIMQKQKVKTHQKGFHL